MGCRGACVSCWGRLALENPPSSRFWLAKSKTANWSRYAVSQYALIGKSQVAVTFIVQSVDCQNGAVSRAKLFWREVFEVAVER